MGKNGSIMTTPEKCFPSGSCIIVRTGDETVLFLFGWAVSVERWQAAEREREEREREGGGGGGREKYCSMFSKCKIPLSCNRNLMFNIFSHEDQTVMEF